MQISFLLHVKNQDLQQKLNDGIVDLQHSSIGLVYLTISKSSSLTVVEVHNFMDVFLYEESKLLLSDSSAPGSSEYCRDAAKA